jgi:Uma2 family endonuclease
LLAKALSTVKNNRRRKNAYEQSEVIEYWNVDPLHYTIEVFTLSAQGEYKEEELYGKEDEIRVGIFDKLVIPLHSIFLG